MGRYESAKLSIYLGKVNKHITWNYTRLQFLEDLLTLECIGVFFFEDYPRFYGQKRYDKSF